MVDIISTVKKHRWPLAVLLWLLAAVAGNAWLLRYSFTAGNATGAPRVVPAWQKASARAQLFLALHPRCPCSRATVNELSKILTRAGRRTEVTVLIYTPVDAPAGWMEGGLADQCRRMQCAIRPDPEGKLAESLGCLTSGSVVVYDEAGRLRYQGGITGSRGHEGDNPGCDAVIQILSGRQERSFKQPVFGCPIQGTAAAPAS